MTRLKAVCLTRVAVNELPIPMLNTIERHIEEGWKLLHCEQVGLTMTDEIGYSAFLMDRHSDERKIVRFTPGEGVFQTTMTTREMSYFDPATLTDLLKAYVMIKRTPTSYCSCCSTDYEPGQLVHYIVIDNDTVCTHCSEGINAQKELRVYIAD